MTSRSHSSAGVKPEREKDAGISDLERMLKESESFQRVCLKVAQILRVHRNEVALLRLEHGSLRFIVPVELRAAGVIPLTGTAVAARTASTRTPLLSNSFARVRHVSLFESVKLGAAEDSEDSELQPIQKIISVPVTNSDGKVLGVVQVSRKGIDPSLAGTDFTGEDLKQLERAAEVLARMPFMQEGAPLDVSST
jgi:hypothetical protein